MKIVRLTAENVKRLTAVEITPKGNVVEIRGRNAAGKSSVLDSIAYALGGKALCPEKPIREGQRRAEVEVDLGDLKVRRVWTLTDTHLTVTASNGEQLRTPQAVLDRLVGKLTFDPLEFARMKPTEQHAVLLDLLGIGDSMDALASEERDAYEARKLANAAAREASSAAAGIQVPPDTPEEMLNVAALTAELGAAWKKKQENDAERAKLRQAEEAVEKCSLEAERLQTELARIQAALNRARESAASAQLAADAQRRIVAELVDPDTQGLQLRIEQAERVNRAVALLQRRRELEQRAADAEKRAKDCEQRLNAIRDRRQEILAGARWPVPGLDFRAGGVLYRGTPFEQCADSEKLWVSLKIAMAANPNLRVLLVRDGSLLDEENWRMLCEACAAGDYQLWIERVGEGGDECAVVIEDGRLRQSPGKEAAVAGRDEGSAAGGPDRTEEPGDSAMDF